MSFKMLVIGFMLGMILTSAFQIGVLKIRVTDLELNIQHLNDLVVENSK